MKLGERIQHLRKEQGLSQEQFAKKLNIGRSTLANYEQCKRDPSYETIELIAKELNVSPAYLMDWEDYKLGSEFEKNVRQIAFELNKDYEELKMLLLTNSIDGEGKTLNYNNLLNGFKEYYAKLQTSEETTAKYIEYFSKHDPYDTSRKMNIEQLSYKKLLNSAGYDLAYENSNFYLVGDMGAILVSETELRDLIKTSVDNAILEIDRITLKKIKENN